MYPVPPLCGRDRVQRTSIGVIETCERGYDTHIACAFDMPLSETACVACGQCTVVCPTAALYRRDDTDKVWAAR